MSSTDATPLGRQINALTFDVFGTCVDWRSSIEQELQEAAATKLASPEFTSLSPDLQARAKALTPADWASFAQEWRNSYGRFTRGFVPGTTPWKDVDAHHRDSLVELLAARDLDGLFSPAELDRLALAWHRLRPWPDSGEGIRALSAAGLVPCTLSNGNRTLLRDLDAFADLGFRRVLSAEDFKAYKPHPSVYLGACRELGCEPGQVVMVAAHLNDLAAARSCGLRTAYVERPREEAWRPDEERYREARRWVDVWVAEGEGGFVELARKLGVA